jgi:hypothetical protein
MARRTAALPVVEPILLTPRAEPFDDPEWLFEPKYEHITSERLDSIWAALEHPLPTHGADQAASSRAPAAPGPSVDDRLKPCG